jgi:NAD(P)-dependent dehydrogenase (short-subunit alcohol dehydrogenase family)
LTLELRGKISLVTGAGRGIGKAIALALGRCGAHVYVASRTLPELEQTAAQIKSLGGVANAIQIDLSDESQINSLFAQIQKVSGKLDILINNAAVGVYAPIHEFRTEDLDAILSVNIRGTFLCCREALRLMLPHKSGYIINISSVTGFKGYPNQAAYGASKHAIMGLTKALAAEYQKHGIRCSAILPGGVDTEMIAASRPDLDRSVLMHPDDVANTVLYLLSLDSTNAAVDQIYIRRKAAAPF